jgi:integrase/recombinase XerD
MTTTLTTTDAEERLIAQWLHGRSSHTQDAYRRDVNRFLVFANLPLDRVTLGDLQAWADQLERDCLAPSSRARALSAVKSLLSFGHRLGLLPVDVGAALRLPPQRAQLAERIIAEPDTQRLLALEPNDRNRVLLRLPYAARLRVSELCGLRWRDLEDRGDRGQVTVFGKGAKTRTVLLPALIWHELQALRDGAGNDAPVFPSRVLSGFLSRVQVERIVRAAAERAGITGAVSPHWLRHAHASHALDRGAPIRLVQATLGHASVATTGRYLHARPTDSSSTYLAI